VRLKNRLLRAALPSLLLALSAPLPAAPALPDLGHSLTKIGKPFSAPAFTLKDMDGKTRSLSEFKGKVVMLNFWATWCPPCRREIPSMEAVYQQLKNSDFVVLAVNEWEPVDMVLAYLGQLEVMPSFPILFDSTGKVAEQYKVKGVPTTVILDRQGRVAYRAVGGRDYEHPEVVGLIQALLKKN
jgi:thiol-disulfide isomerase/thioredoxin